MTKLTVKDTVSTPSDELIAKANASVTVTDEKGRVITLKKPSVLTQYRLVEILGDSASNLVYMNMVMPLIFVSAIDGDLVMPFASKREVEALIQLLDEEGITAVTQKVAEVYGETDIEKDKAALKN